MVRTLLTVSVFALAGSAYADCGADHGAAKQGMSDDQARASRAPVIAQAPAKPVKATPQTLACDKGNCDVKRATAGPSAKTEKIVSAN
jgi:hypothetical protein